MMAQTLTYLEQDLQALFDGANLSAVLDEACRYAMHAGGKRIRPQLVVASFLTVGGHQDDVAWAMVRRAAMAVELLHGYSLVHDDLPCMDDDDLRRGRPTCHIVYGENVALLVGDVLQSLAFEALTMPLAHLPQDEMMSANLCRIFAPRARRMVSGQMLDVLGENQTLTQGQLEAIHQDKTGALIEAAILMGGVCAGVDNQKVADLSSFAKHLGLAFQVQDDVLDVVGDTVTLGKPVGSDDKLNKSTYVKLLGIDGAKKYADTLFERAKADAKKLQQKHMPIPLDNALLSLTQRIAQRQK